MRYLVRHAWAMAAVLLTLGGVVGFVVVGGGRMFSPGGLNAQSRRSAPLGGVSSHAAIGGDCAACHVPPLSGDSMANRCLNCHTDVRRQLDAQQPLHGATSEGARCRSCHTEHHGAQGALTDLARFDHDWTAFKLTGKHRQADCKSCHIDNVYQDVAQTCASCHAEPKIHKGRFGAECAQCHTTTTWAGAVFNHDRTGFKLTGKHQRADCKSCHINSVYHGLPQACASCHAEPQVHKGRFGADCAQCHSTSTWAGAVFKHTFPLNHGHQRRTIDCATCHKEPDHFQTYTCYGCHEHEPEKIARRHRRIANFQNCVRCHRTGGEHEGRRGEG